MKGRVISAAAGTLVAYVAMLGTSASAGSYERRVETAHPLNCQTTVSAVGVSSQVEGGRDFERYRGEVPPGLARMRAIDNWSLAVTNACPQYSNKWWRSRGQNIACEGAAGHEYCTARAQPAKKFWSFLYAN